VDIALTELQIKNAANDDNLKDLAKIKILKHIYRNIIVSL